MQLERDEIQGIVFSGYADKPYATFLLLRVRAAAGAGDYLSWFAERVTTGGRRGAATCENIAVSATGLRALGLSSAVLEGFPREFVEGMGTPKRAEILGDCDSSAPAHWLWGGPQRRVDLLLMVYALDADQLSRALARHRARFGNAIDEVYARTTQWLPQRREHFGFADGIAQPAIRGLHTPQPGAAMIEPGEFILGYDNAYRVRPASPCVPLTEAATLLSPGPEPKRRDLGRNGSYLVLRQLDQDVAGFWCTMHAQAEGDHAEAIRLAAKCVGRWPSGAPLALSPLHDDPSLAARNDFSYANDPRGLCCPIGAHVRRANPRDSLEPSPAVSEQRVRRHAILRRGRSYGPPLPLGSTRDDGHERGLAFMCINANIARQFEFIQQSWVNNPKFAGLPEGRDPLIGPGLQGEAHRIPGAPVRQRLCNLPRFTRVRGGEYFFLPSRSALSFLGARAREHVRECKRAHGGVLPS